MKYVDLKTQKKSLPKKKGPKSRVIAVLLSLLVISAIPVIILVGSKKGWLNTVTFVATVTAAEVKNTDGRTNILLLGSDRRNEYANTRGLTDTLIVASVNKIDGDVVLISLPRDLWVHSPAGYKSKINAIYTYGGAEESKKVIENVLGIPIHYYGVVDFNIFTETINIVNGINVNVEKAFEDYEYPIEGKEDDMCGRTEEQLEELEEESPLRVFPCRYQHLIFNQGLQAMDGETALQYARSRHGTNGENTDFARAKRQQKVIVAVKDKALSMNTLLNPAKIKDLYDSYSKNIDTNITLTDIQSLYALSQQMEFNNIRSVVLDDRSSAEVGGLLYAPLDTSLYGGQYVLIPRAGDFSQIHAYVQRYLFGVK
jgi:polyisoprenyl-teichoic acid--peptidoglycan teichoic acid transferase